VPETLTITTSRLEDIDPIIIMSTEMIGIVTERRGTSKLKKPMCEARQPL
jgi:hypothetical protein